VLEEAIEGYGKPEIVNSDQGSQYTSALWINFLEGEGIKISMDGKGRALDNVWIERFWKSIKYEYVYLNPCDDGFELAKGLQTTSNISTKRYIISHSKNKMTYNKKINQKVLSKARTKTK
jgi:putative transposase